MKKHIAILLAVMLLLTGDVQARSNRNTTPATTEDKIIEAINAGNSTEVENLIKNEPYFMLAPIKNSVEYDDLDAKQRNAYELAELSYELSDMPVAQAVLLKDLDRLKKLIKARENVNKIHPQYGTALDIAGVLEDTSIKVAIVAELKNAGAKSKQEQVTSNKVEEKNNDSEKASINKKIADMPKSQKSDSNVKEIVNKNIESKKKENILKQACNGIGGYKLGDKYKTNMTASELKANGYWVNTKDFKAVGAYKQWAEIAVSPKTHTICDILLVGPKGKTEFRTHNFEMIEVSIPDKEMMKVTFEALCNHYEEPKSMFNFVDLYRESEINWEDVSVKIGIMQPLAVNELQGLQELGALKDIIHYKRISGYHYLECRSENLMRKFRDEIDESEKNLLKEKASEIDLSGLN